MAEERKRKDLWGFFKSDEKKKEYVKVLLEFQKKGYEGYTAIDYPYRNMSNIWRDASGCVCDGKGNLINTMFVWSTQECVDGKWVLASFESEVELKRET